MIVIVDDDVNFAEEIQDILTMHGHSMVVVVTHPHASSLDLLEQATLLILDLSFAATTALAVLDEVRGRGSNPQVVMVSGSGADVLEIARTVAIDRGFSILGALTKPFAADELLHLLARTGIACLTPAHSKPDAETAPPLPIPTSHSYIFSCTSQFGYAGSHVRSSAASAPSALPPDPLSFLSRTPSPDAIATLRAAASARYLLALDGRDGFVVAQLPDAALLDAGLRSELCFGSGYSAPLRSRIVFELGPEISASPLAHTAAMVDLRLAGYGLLLQASYGAIPPAATIVELPITILAVDGIMPRTAQRTSSIAESTLHDAIDLLRCRAVASLCLDLSSFDEFTLARDLGFNLAGTSPAGKVESLIRPSI
jgi:CheY-like chemotaxis protein